MAPVSIGRRLLAKLDRTSESGPVSAPPGPQVPDVDEDQLVAVFREARNGGPTAVDRLSSLLIDADRTDDAALTAFAVSLLGAGDPALWKNLDLATRRTWWGVSDWAKQAQERMSGEPSSLAIVVASFHHLSWHGPRRHAEGQTSFFRS